MTDLEADTRQGDNADHNTHGSRRCTNSQRIFCARLQRFQQHTVADASGNFQQARQAHGSCGANCKNAQLDEFTVGAPINEGQGNEQHVQPDHQHPVLGLVVLRVRGQPDDGAGCDADKGSQIGRSAGHQNADEQYQRNQGRPAQTQRFAQLGHFFISQSAQSVALGFEVNLHEHAKEMHESRHHRGRHNRLVGQIQEFDHQESSSTEHWRGDLTACRGSGFHSCCKVALVPHADHGRNGQRADRHGIGHR